MYRPRANDDGSTKWFVVHAEICDRDLAARACHVVPDLVRFTAARAVVDAYTDRRKVMPSAAEAAEDALWELAKPKHEA